MGAFKTTIEGMDSGSDLIVPGDVDTIVVQQARGAGESIMSLIDHLESQVNTGLNFPEILIAGRADAQGSIIQMDSLERDVKTIQDVLGLGMIPIYIKVLGKEDVPETAWNPMNIETELRTARTLRQLVGDGTANPIITVDEARDRMGYVEMTDEQKKEIEKQKQLNKPAPFGNEPGKPGETKPTGNPGKKPAKSGD
jgi:hypothetical protein